MYQDFIDDLKNGKNFNKVGSARLLNIQVILDNKLIYDGSSEETPKDIKDLYYYKTDIKDNKFIFYVDSEMCKMINERNKKNNLVLELKELKPLEISNEIKIPNTSIINNKEMIENNSTINNETEKEIAKTNYKNIRENATNTKITKEDYFIETVDKKFKEANFSNVINKNIEILKFSDKNIKDMSELEFERDIRILFNKEMNRYDEDRNHYEKLDNYYDDYRKNSPADLEIED